MSALEAIRAATEPVRVNMQLPSPFLPSDRFQALCADSAAAVGMERGWPSCTWRVVFREHLIAAIEVMP